MRRRMSSLSMPSGARASWAFPIASSHDYLVGHLVDAPVPVMRNRELGITRHAAGLSPLVTSRPSGSLGELSGSSETSHDEQALAGGAETFTGDDIDTGAETGAQLARNWRATRNRTGGTWQDMARRRGKRECRICIEEALKTPNSASPGLLD